MKKLFLVTCFGLAWTASSVFAQLQPLNGDELPGAVLLDTDTYTPETIWNYNSDMATLVSEYGFRSLLVQKVVADNQNYQLEAYFMTSAEAAFGIYSINRLKGLRSDSLTRFDCLTQYQYQAAYGMIYLIITQETGTLAARNFSDALAGKFLQLNPQQQLELPSVFRAPAFADNLNQIVFLSGLNGMQNSLLPWTNLIVGVRFSMYAVILPDPRGEIYFAQISFPTQADQYNFLNRALLMQNGVPVQAYWDNSFLFREFVPAGSSPGPTIYFLQCVQPVAIAEITEQ